ncbi:MAG: homoserine kinase [Oscillospiraceae bacterium]
MIKIKVPATSANLGAGFDSLGLALNLYNYVLMDLSDKIEITSSDEIVVPNNEDNLIYSSAKHLFNLCQKPLKGLKIVQENNIPMARGLGSSSACIVAGLVGANYLLGNIFSKDDLVNIATKLEGHPDNVLPAFFGGVLTSAIENDKVYWVKQKINKDIKFVAIIPDFKISTQSARECLPQYISHIDARYNLSRSALFIASIAQGKYENIRVAVGDKLHQPYRLSLINKAEDIFKQIYLLNGYGAYISGSGSTLMAIVDAKDEKFEYNIKEFLDKNELYSWQVKNLYADNNGTQVSVL